MTLVAPGKNICWVGGVAEFFDCHCGGFQNLEQSLKTTHSIRVQS